MVDIVESVAKKNSVYQYRLKQFYSTSENGYLPWIIVPWPLIVKPNQGKSVIIIQIDYACN